MSINGESLSPHLMGRPPLSKGNRWKRLCISFSSSSPRLRERPSPGAELTTVKTVRSLTAFYNVIILDLPTGVPHLEHRAREAVDWVLLTAPVADASAGLLRRTIDRLG